MTKTWRERLYGLFGGDIRDELRGEERNVHAYIAAAVIAALAVLAIQIGLCARFTGPQISDSRSYVELAMYCAENRVGYPGPRDMYALYIFGNGYVNLLSWLMRIEMSEVWVYAINIVCTQIVLAATAAIARQLTGRVKPACVAVILLSLMPSIWGDAPSARTEMLFMALALTSIALMMTRRTACLAAAGCAMALCNWVRPLLVVFLPGVALYFVMKRVRLRGVAAYLAAMLAVIGIIGADAKSRTGEFVFQAQTMGVNMLMGANDDADGSYVDTIYDEGKIGYVQPGTGVTFKLRDERYRALAVEWMLVTPGPLLSLAAAELFFYLITDTYGGTAFFNNEKATDNLDYFKELGAILLGRGERALALGDVVVIWEQLIYMAVAVLYLVSIVDSLRRGYIADTLMMHLIFALSCGVTILTVGGARYHLPYVPFFCICAASWICMMKIRRGEKKN